MDEDEKEEEEEEEDVVYLNPTGMLPKPTESS